MKCPKENGTCISVQLTSNGKVLVFVWELKHTITCKRNGQTDTSNRI